MPTRPRIVLLALAAAVIPACAGPDPIEPPATSGRQSPAVLERRAERARALAAARLAAVPQAVAVPPDIQAAMLAALDIPDSFHPRVLSITTPELNASAALPNLGIIKPIRGPSLLMLSTGKTTTAATAEPGFDFPPVGTESDEVRFRFTVTLPDNVDRMSFDYTFLSAEYPEFVNAGFSDAFIATVSDGDSHGTDRQIHEVSVDDTNFHSSSTTTVGDNNPFNLVVDDPSGIDHNFGIGQDTDAGTTGWQRKVAEVHGRGQPVTIEFSIHDVGDGRFDSAILIDNVAFSTIEMVDPHSAVGLIDEFGHVALDPQLTATLGDPVRAVTADGVTQVLLRATLPGPGTATFKIDSASATDGRLSANTDPLDWRESVKVDTVRLPGQSYAFALYQSPAAFNTGTDQDRPLRTAKLTMTYTDDTGTSFDQPFTIDIMRPPVIIVPDLWTSCRSWTDINGLMQPDGDPDHPIPPDLRHPFSIACAAYTLATGSSGLLAKANQRVVPDLISQELNKLRDTGVAATRVDMIGHGMGGLLARLYIDQSFFVQSDNFNEGTINRLILVDTPQLGSRLADEIVRFRKFAKASVGGKPPVWTGVLKALQTQNDHFLAHPDEPDEAARRILLDPCNGDLSIDDMTTTSPIINSIGTRTDPPRHVAYHVIVTGAGHDVSPVDATSLDPDRSTLYLQMQLRGPVALSLPPTLRSGWLFGPQSAVFCPSPGDDHDLFTTVTEQLGGLDPASPFVSGPFAVDPLNLASGHFQVEHDHDHTRRLIDLLNAPDGAAFTTSLRLPRDLDRGNHCPISIMAPIEKCPAPAIAPAVQAPAVSGSSIAIVSPAPGTTVAPGATISVVVEAQGDAQPEAVIVIAASRVIVLEQAPFRTQVTLPATAFGSTAIDAIAFYPDGDVAFADQVLLPVRVTATLTSLRTLAGDIVLPRPGSTRQLSVLGKFSDGIERDLTRASRGTLYGSSSLTPIAAVSPDGLVTGLAPGNATIVVRNGNVFTSINAKVGAPACGDEVLDLGEQCDDGNITSGDGCSRTCQIENTAPVAVCDSPTVCTDPGRCAASVTALGSGSSDPESDALTISQTPPGPYSVGEHAVSVTVSDGALASQCTSQLDVLDCEPPALHCPADFAVECTADGGAPVAPPDATATDNCAVTVQPPTGGRLALGSHPLTYTASDPSDNRTTCTTTVVVQDTTPPVLHCPAPSVAECTGAGRASVDPGTAEASDRCTAASVTAPGPGLYPLGTTAITYVASDGSGNRSTCETSVTVKDTIAPTLSCPPPSVAECTDDHHAVVDPGHATASDACTAVSVVDPGAGRYALGTTPVTFTAADQSGNPASCVTPVTVRDTTPPVLTCPAPTVAECTGAGQAVVDPGIAAASDACTATAVDRPGSSRYPLGTTPVRYAAHDEAGNQASCTTRVTVHDTTPPDIACPASIRAECTGQFGAFVRPTAAAASDVCTAVTIAGPRPSFYPLGTTAIAYTATDQTGNQASCRTAVEVVDTRPAEVFVTRTPRLLAPDHQYRTISLEDCGITVRDACGGDLAPRTYQPAITCVTSDEPEDAAGPGDGRTTDDIVIVDHTRVRLRAERDGARDGRVYKIHFRVQDGAGNPSEGTCAVLVPRDPGCDQRSPERCPVGDSGVASSICAH